LAVAGVTETEFQRQVTDLAELLGWSWVHFRSAQTSKGWRTPVSGPLGKGWVDLVLVRVRDGRLMFVELKADKGKVSADQAAVLAVLEETAHFDVDGPGWSTHVWRPADFDEIVKVLQ
jgi:hypothetical protein